jgi:hypothetical protein
MKVKNKILNFQLQRNVILVKEMDQSQVLLLIDARLVVEMVK